MRHAGENVVQHCYITEPSRCNWVEMRDMKADCFAIPRVKQNKDILFLYEVVWKDLLLTSTGIPNWKHNFVESILWFSVWIWHTRYTQFILVTMRKLDYQTRMTDMLSRSILNFKHLVSHFSFTATEHIAKCRHW